MPVTPVSFASKSDNPAGASGTLTVPVNVPANIDNPAVLVGMYWCGDTNISAATFGATFDGVAMTQMNAQLWDNTDRLAMYGLSNPTAGLNDAVLSYSGVPASDLRCLGVVAAVYSGVGGIDDTVSATVTSTASNTVVVPSVNPAYRTVFLHGGRHDFSAYNQVKRASLRMRDSTGALWWWTAIGGEVLLGDAAGAATVTSTATQTEVHDNWDAIGVNLAAAPVNLTFGTVKVAPPTTSMALSVYRVQEIDNARTWKIGTKGRAPTWERDPQSVYDYTWDWADILTGDDDIVAASFTSSAPGLELLSWNHTTTTATVWVRGPATSNVTCHMITDGGREDERTATIKAVQK